MSAKEGDLKIWWMPKASSERFEMPADTPEEAVKMLTVLAKCNKFEHEHGIKPDCRVACGLSVFEGGEWVEWTHPETGMDLIEYICRVE